MWTYFKNLFQQVTTKHRHWKGKYFCQNVIQFPLAILNSFRNNWDLSASPFQKYVQANCTSVVNRGTVSTHIFLWIKHVGHPNIHYFFNGAISWKLLHGEITKVFYKKQKTSVYSVIVRLAVHHHHQLISLQWRLTTLQETGQVRPDVAQYSATLYWDMTTSDEESGAKNASEECDNRVFAKNEKPNLWRKQNRVAYTLIVCHHIVNLADTYVTT